MKLSELPLHEIRIGQIVRFDHSGKFATVVRVTTELAFTAPDQSVTSRNRESILAFFEYLRCPTVDLLFEGDNLKQGLFITHLDNCVVMNRVLKWEPENEFLRISEIFNLESRDWEEVNVQSNQNT